MNIGFIATGYKELDITNIEDFRTFVVGKSISHIINCTAYNDVDKAESEPDKAFLLNKDAPVLLAIVASEIGAVKVC